MRNGIVNYEILKKIWYKTKVLDHLTKTPGCQIGIYKGEITGKYQKQFYHLKRRNNL